MGDPFWHVVRQKDLQIAPVVLALHAGSGKRHLVGRADIKRGTHPIARLALWVCGFPPRGRDVPLILTVCSTQTHTDWVRDFNGHKTLSRLWFDADRLAVQEAFGPFRLRLDLHADHGQLLIKVAGVSFCGIPLPRWLHPISETREFENEAGKFAFDVSGHLRGFGLLIRYTGHLTPVDK